MDKIIIEKKYFGYSLFSGIEQSLFWSEGIHKCRRKIRKSNKKKKKKEP